MKKTQKDPQNLLEQIYTLKNKASAIRQQIYELQNEHESIEHKIDVLLSDWRASVAESKLMELDSED